jgi:hypothetical protein
MCDMLWTSSGGGVYQQTKVNTIMYIIAACAVHQQINNTLLIQWLQQKPPIESSK